MKYKCVLCNDYKVGYGNNAYPLEVGICCDDCNTKVIIARLSELKGKPKTLKSRQISKKNNHGN